MNHSVLTGNLGADPDVFFTGNGEPVASFKLAFQTGHKKQEPNWIKVACFKPLVDVCQK